MLPIFGSDTLLKRTMESKKRNCDLQFLLVLLIRFYCMGKQHIECVLLCSLIYTILNYTTGRKFFKDQPELLGDMNATRHDISCSFRRTTIQ